MILNEYVMLCYQFFRSIITYMHTYIHTSYCWLLLPIGPSLETDTSTTLLRTSAENTFYKSGKPFYGYQQTAHKYYCLVGLGLGFGLWLLCRLGLVLRLGSV